MNLFIVFYITSQIAIFVGVYIYMNTNRSISCICKKIPITFPLAKASAALISVNTTLLILSCVNFTRKYWVALAFNHIHYTFALAIFVWSVVHSISHIINFTKLNVVNFEWVAFTGLLLVINLMLFGVSALKILRKTVFHKFMMIHTLLFYSYFVTLFAHQSFCFIKSNSGNCILPTSWIIVLPTLLAYIYERCKMYATPRVTVSDVHRIGNILQLHLHIKPHLAGKTVKICCPDISYFEWHPFAVTFRDQNTCCLHIKIRGDWTTKFSAILGTNRQLPNLLVYGPISCYPTNLVHLLESSDSILVASGIGTTTFGFLFQCLSERENALQSNLLIILIVKSIADISWALPVLSKIVQSNPSISIQLFLTNSNHRSFSPPSFNGSFNLSFQRPNFPLILDKQFLLNQFKRKKYNVYFSGSSSVYNSLKVACSLNPHFSLFRKL